MPERADGDDAPEVALAISVKQHQHTVALASRARRPRRGGMKDKGPCWTLTAYQFLDNDQLSNLDTLLVSLGPSACHLVMAGLGGKKGGGKGSKEGDAAEEKPKGVLAKVLGVLERRGVPAVKAEAKAFKTDSVMTDLSKILTCDADAAVGDTAATAEGLSIVQGVELEKPLALSCVAALIAQLKLLRSAPLAGGGGGGGGGGDNEDGDEGEEGDEGGAQGGEGGLVGEGSHELKVGSLEAFMRLDSAAADAVTLLPDAANPHQFGSLFQILNRCKTKMGSRMLERWLRQPLVSKVDIENRHDIVSIFVAASGVRGALRDGPLKDCPDLDTLKAKVARHKAGLGEVYRLYRFVQGLGAFEQHLTSFTDGELEEEQAQLLKEKFVKPFGAIMEDFGHFEELVEHVLDMSALPELVVNPSYSATLKELRREIDDVRDQVDDIYNEAAEGWACFDGAKCSLEEDKQRGFSLRLTKGNLETQLQARHKQVETLAVLKNGVYFTIPKLARLGKQLLQLKRSYEEQQAGLVAKAVQTAATYLPVMETAAALVAELDVLVSFAEVAALAPQEYVRPSMRPRGDMVLKLSQARHPCLEWQDEMTFMPNGYNMTKDEGRFLVITGPNMGGKSTYIRTVGAIVVMAQVGAFVPCESAEISIRDAIFARVGAGDAQQRGISTFMSEMLEASSILSSATKDSLLIIDELGRGTSTFDGFGLAWAISEYIVDHIQAFALFATHYHEMTSLPLSRGCVQNWHVSAVAEMDKITMLYEVKKGPCLQSFGIHVAAMAGFPAKLIRDAKRKAAMLESFQGSGETMAVDGQQGVTDGVANGENVGGDTTNKRSKGRAVHDVSKLHRLADAFKRLPLDMVDPKEAVKMTRSLVDKLYVNDGGLPP